MNHLVPASVVVLFSLIFTSATGQEQSQDATMEAAEEASIGSTVEVRWAGPGIQYDSIYIVKPDAADGARGINSDSITSGKNPLRVVMPDSPGTYELRYWDNKEKRIAGRKSIRVVDVETLLSPPATVKIGEVFFVPWEGPGNSYERIALVEAGAADDGQTLSQHGILNPKPAKLVAPATPGEYEVRYYTRQEKRVLARAPVIVEDVETSLSAPEQADLGANVEVEWVGPGNDYDLIGLYEKDAADNARQIVGTAILRQKNPVGLKLPEQPGEYEIRYIMTQGKRVLARRPIQVGGVETSLQATESVEIGGVLQVDWIGPGNDYDRVAIYPSGAADEAESLGEAAILNGKNPLQFKAPEQAGDYELRYVTATSKRILARRDIRVATVSASLDAPDKATAMTPIDVGWEGPGNDYDQIALFESDAPDDAEPVRVNAILSGKNPVPLIMPEKNGEYELRYRLARSMAVLARRPIVVEPAGRLAVVFETEREVSSSGVGAVEIILDASGSMLQREGEKRRIEIARSVLNELVSQHLTDDRAFALRVFGHKEANSCRTDLEIPLGPLDRQQAGAKVAAINAMNLAKTPIADSLARVPSDLSAAEGPKTVILITDGEETCDGDPAAVIQNLRASGLDVQVSIVGFAIDDADLKSDFESWAQLGGGSYFDARSAEELTQSIRTVISGPFRVLDAVGNVVGRGVIGGAPVVLPAGIYRVETVGSTPQVIEGVEVKPEELTEASF